MNSCFENSKFLASVLILLLQPRHQSHRPLVVAFCTFTAHFDRQHQHISIPLDLVHLLEKSLIAFWKFINFKFAKSFPRLTRTEHVEQHETVLHQWPVLFQSSGLVSIRIASWNLRCSLKAGLDWQGRCRHKGVLFHWN